MTKIDNLTEFADQVTTLILPDSTTTDLELFFNGATEKWTANVTFGETVINGISLTNSPNILRQWRNIIPFGLAVVSKDQTDPFDINDFVSERVSLFLLDAQDVIDVEVTILGGIS